MWPVIHGHAERIPIHPSFAIYESANRPEDVTEDIHRATTLPALSGSEYLSLLSFLFCLNFTFTQSDFYTSARSHSQLCVEFFNSGELL